MSLLNRLLDALGINDLWALILRKFPVLQQLLDLGKKIIEHFTGVFQAGVNLVTSAEAEFAAWKHFKEDVRFKQRVIQVERALTKAQEFFTAIISAWKAIVQLIKDAGIKLETGGAAEIAEAATGVGLPLAVVNAIVIVVEVLDTVRNLIDTAQNIVTVVTDLRELLEGDLIFLQQKNTRRVEKLADGSSIKIRVGNLHS
jgi:hypothetical protein